MPAGLYIPTAIALGYTSSLNLILILFNFYVIIILVEDHARTRLSQRAAPLPVSAIDMAHPHALICMRIGAEVRNRGRSAAAVAAAGPWCKWPLGLCMRLRHAMRRGAGRGGGADERPPPSLPFPSFTRACLCAVVKGEWGGGTRQCSNRGWPDWRLWPRGFCWVSLSPCP